MTPSASVSHDELARALQRGRNRTLSLIAPLSDDDVHDQPIDLLSPLVWDVGHIAVFEDLWLVRNLTGRASPDPERDRFYDAFENARWTRSELPLMPRDETVAYLTDVRHEALSVLRGVELAPDVPLLAGGGVHRMIAQHESQHQETMLQSLGLRHVPYGPARRPPAAPARRVDDTERVTVPGGTFPLGTDEVGWSHDNERPSQLVHVPTFALDRFPVTCRRYAAFVAACGYDRPELWTERGWAWRQATGHTWPQGWSPASDGGWQRRRFGHLEPLDPAEPVQHVSWFEADAFARWAGGRLPTEVEWEKAASWDPATGAKRRYPWGDSSPTPRVANLAVRQFGPTAVGSYPDGASAYGIEQLAGDVYEWTSSPFEGYPRFTSFPYAEYSEVFFGGDYRVLRGSSWAIGPALARTTYRNWDHPYRRQIFAGVRVAYDV